MSPRVGVLALQGDFALHRRMVEQVGFESGEVRTASDLEGLAGLVIPGGESTTMMMGIEREGLAAPIAEMASAGLPVFGTCAGMVLLSRSHLGLLDVDVERNSYGRQVRSFETDLDIAELGDPPVRGIFIRAPRVIGQGDDVEVVASLDGDPVFVRQGSVSAISFHPELVGDPRLHSLALSSGSSVGSRAAAV